MRTHGLLVHNKNKKNYAQQADADAEEGELDGGDSDDSDDGRKRKKKKKKKKCVFLSYPKWFYLPVWVFFAMLLTYPQEKKETQSQIIK